MITEKIVIEGDSSGAVNASEGLIKEIKNLKKELSTLETGTDEYTKTFNKLSEKMKEQNNRMLELRKNSSANGLMGDIQKLRLELNGLTEGTAEYDRVAGELSKKMKIQADRMEFLRASSADFGDVVGNTAKTMAGMVGVYSAINNAIGLFAGDNEELQKTLLRVQQLMGIIQGLSAIDEGIKGFERLKANIKGYVNELKKASDATVGTANAAKLTEDGLTASTVAGATAQTSKGKEAVTANQKITESDNAATLQQIANIDKVIAAREKRIAEFEKEIEANNQALDNKLNNTNPQSIDDLVEIGDVEAVNKYNDAITRQIDINKEDIKIRKEQKEILQKITKEQEKATKGTGPFITGIKGIGNSLKGLGLAIKSIGKAMISSLGVFALISAAMWGIMALIDLFKKRQEEANRVTQKWIDYNTEYAKSVAGIAGSNIAKFKIIQKEWNNLNGNVKEQNKYLNEHKKQFADVFGSNKKTLQEYNDYFNKFSDNIINGYLTQAKVAAYTQLLQKNIEKSIQLDLTPVTFEGKYINVKGGGQVLLPKYQKNLDKAREERKKERNELKKEYDKLIEGITTSTEKADILLPFTNEKENTNNKTKIIKTFTELETTYNTYIQKYKDIYRNFYQEQMTDNEKFLFDLNKNNINNYEILYQGTKNYYDKLKQLNIEKAYEDKRIADIEAETTYNLALQEINTNIKAIQDNAKLDKRKLKQEEIELIKKYGDEKIRLEGIYNTKTINNTIDLNEKLRVIDQDYYNNNLNNLLKYYDNRMSILDSRLQREMNFLNIIYNEKKSELIKNNDVSLIGLLFGNTDKNEFDKTILDFDYQISTLNSELEKGLKKQEELRKKRSDMNLNPAERLKAENDYNQIIQENSEIRIRIAENESNKIKAINEQTISYITSGIEGVSDILSNLSSINDDNLTTLSNNLKTQFSADNEELKTQLEQGVITKETYDAKMIKAENDYNKKVYDLEVEHNERAKKIQIFQAIIETLTSATKSYSSLAGIPVVGPVLGAAAAAAALAAGYARVRAIQSQQIEKPNMGSLSANSDTTNAALNTNLIYQSANLEGQNQQTLNVLNNQKIFVSVTDINNVQKKVKVVENNSTF